MRLYKLDDIVLEVSGNAEKFLNGLTSNSLDQPFNAFLNQHGRVIATCAQEKRSEDHFLLSVPQVANEALLKHLERYAKLNHTSLIPSAEYRSYMNIDSGRVVFSNEITESNVSDEEFTLFRLERKIPLMGVSAKGGSVSGGDFQADEFILNIDEFKFTSYTKGCFLGQEPVAKVHNRSKPSRRLVVKFEDECSTEEIARMTSKVKDPVTGRVKGFVFELSRAQ